MQGLVRRVVARYKGSSSDALGSEHYLVKCRICDGIIRQCRCTGPKTITYEVCDSCSGVEPRDPYEGLFG